MAERAAKAIFGVAGILLVSRLLGFFREVVIADVFGTTARYDLYLVAVMLPALLYGVLNFASVYLFVPYFSRRTEKTESGETEVSWTAVWPAVNLAALISAVLVILMIALAPLVMKIWGGHYLGDDFGRIVLYCRLTAVMVLLGTTEAFMRAYLNVRRIFTYPAAGYIVYNVFCIAAIVVLHDRLSVGAIVVGLLGGLLVQNVYLLMKVLSFKPFEKFVRKVSDSDTKALLAAGGIIILIELINRSYFLIDRYVAPQFGEGVISALNYGQVLIQLPDSIIGLAIGAVVFPMFSQVSGEAQNRRFGDVYQKAVAGAMLVAIPIAVFYLINAEDLVSLLFRRGQFDRASVAMTAGILRPYAPSIVALFVISTSIRACYSGGWGKYVLAFTVVVFATKFVGTFVLPGFFGYAGITAATATAHVSFAALMLIFLTLKVPATDTVRFVWNVVMLLLTGVVAGLAGNHFNGFIAGYSGGSGYQHVLARLALSGAFLVVLYWLGLHFMGLKGLYREFFRRRRD
ncbi:MAG: hypothetical protein JSW34_03500 [Candidatus Zixiibacteriota bacterium]|nr:MAG: hypothetical protein JSW34_03500 [candidate division Zixibacteria bacterium]